MAKRTKGGRKPGTWSTITPEEIRAFREEHQISRSRLAGALGVSSTTIQNWETHNGVAMPRLQQRVADLIKAGPSALSPVSRQTSSGGSGYDPTAVVGQQVTAAAQIVTGYMTATGGKLSTAELLELIKSVRGALT